MQENIQPSNMLEIVLNEDTLTMHGTADQSVGCALRGTLKVNLEKETKVKTLFLRLKGKLKLKMNSDMPRREESLIDQTWPILERSHQLHTLEEGRYQYDFEYPLSGKLPESVKVSHGKIIYKLYAVLERPGFHRTTKISRPLVIHRVPLPSTLEFTDSPNTMISGTWASRMYYEAAIPSTTFAPGETFPVTFHFYITDPLLEVDRIHASMREYTIYRSASFVRPSVQSKRLSDLAQDYSRPENVSDWEATIHVQVPDSVKSDCGPDHIEVSHKLVVKFCISQGGLVLDTVIHRFPIVVQPLEFSEVTLAPPAYNSIGSTCPLPPAYEVV
ncbi:hypothetical protein K493DRAFT_287988 [Basidiobolus meristosporus CBS 931.73]|uniref:Arrestin C-terminal-like domain-containing protein n=1 Tax=Basidiobolus meristosporus CBS 931.73 TaxID=1314790 RepID=A0A1Y1XXK1_9FUNG|nr:hypothetical protein K493DRAFT_287988 [Basidiobolus meristosporus CBS 931.73]|eukprot:ORX90480.1 hypothetical protein K493DRAFT_287988 [Basidiobolus meristosporus CBS 931.73]